MKADENAVGAEKRTAKAFYPKRVFEDDLKRQEARAPALARLAAEAEKKEPKAKDWHTFKTP
jgi:hypothetical protein